MTAPLRISELVIDPPVLLAPMAGYTDAAFRSLCRDFHCGFTFTEVVNAEGIVHGSRPTRHLLETVPGERPVAAHIYGRNPESMARAAAMIAEMNRFDSIDINCGCPVRKIVAKGCGAALMRDLGRMREIIRAIRESVTLPVTVKTRIGFSPDVGDSVDIARAAEAGGADAISIHARFAVNHHGGPADWTALARIKSECSIPVIGNGGITAARDAPAMLEQTGVDGVMIGRAAVGNPWIFDEARCLLNGKPYAPHSRDEHRAVILDHFKRLAALKILEGPFRRRSAYSAEQAAVLHFRAHLVRYLSGFRGWRDVRRSLSTMQTVEAFEAAVKQVLGPTRK